MPLADLFLDYIFDLKMSKTTNVSFKQNSKDEEHKAMKYKTSVALLFFLKEKEVLL